ncbi:MAG: sugar phosphate isomerase/epimerase [Victivallales bacterium]|jgi:sugar phosphate isomerase/epimerase|nr:sugar phosphate isomerase/epimerase [Victivallales bacterium]
MTTPAIGLQLYSVRGECSKDLAATLKTVAEIGYVGAEPYGYRGDEAAWLGHSAQAVRGMFDDAGLICCGMHISTDALLGDNLARTIELNQILGNKFLIVAADGPRTKSVAGIAELAGILNDAAAKLAPLGLFTGYHAHPFDAAEIEGSPAWFRLFRQTNPEVVMQMDVGNYLAGDGDPIGAMKEFVGRARTVHVKDYNAPLTGAIGTGEAPVAEFLELCETIHPTEWYVVEECAPQGLGFEVVQRAYDALKAMGK